MKPPRKAPVAGTLKLSTLNAQGQVDYLRLCGHTKRSAQAVISGATR